MFDIGFSELIIISLIALIVIGPKRLPGVARTLGHFAGRLRRYVDDVKADISREMELDELRRMQREMQGAARDFEQTMKSAASDVATGVRSVENELNSAATPAAEPATAATAAPLPAPADAAPPRQAPLPGFDKI